MPSDDAIIFILFASTVPVALINAFVIAFDFVLLTGTLTVMTPPCSVSNLEAKLLAFEALILTSFASISTFPETSEWTLLFVSAIATETLAPAAAPNTLITSISMLSSELALIFKLPALITVSATFAIVSDELLK